MDEWEERRRYEFDKAAELQERHAAAIERMSEGQHHEVVGDSAVDRMAAYFMLPPEQQDFRLREEAALMASRIGGDIETVLSNADRLFAYIRG